MGNLTTCPSCNGAGRYAHYSATDFEGERECSECRGSGLVILRDKKGRFAKYERKP